MQEQWPGTEVGASTAQQPSAPPPAPAPRAQAPSVAPSSAPSQPRGIRNNNPGNIEDGAFARSLPGYRGSDGRFAIFDGPEAGDVAKTRLLGSYIERGFNTPNKIINRWAPPSENDSASYARFVAEKVGIGPDDIVTADMIPAISAAIYEMENGVPAPSAAEPEAAWPGQEWAGEEIVDDSGAAVNENGFLVDNSGPQFGTEQNPWESRDLNDLIANQDIREGDMVRYRNDSGETWLGRYGATGGRGGVAVDQGNGVRIAETGLGQTIGAGALAAAEQLPFMQDSLAFGQSVLRGQSMDEARADIARLRGTDQATDQGARNVGGLAGFGIGLAAPMAGARWAGQGSLGARSLKSLALGTGSGFLYGFGTGQGSALERLKSGGTGAALGGVFGGATPAVGGAAARAAEPVTNWVGRQINRLSGGRVAQQFSPSSRASQELANNLRDDGITEEMFTESMNRLEGLGVQPTFLDVVQSIAPNGKTSRAMRGAAMHDDASTIATQYADNFAESMPAIGQNITRELAPNAPGNAAMMQRADDMIANALPQRTVEPGSGGAAVSSALNASRDAAKREVDEAYNIARGMEPERALVPSDVAKDISDNVRNSLADFDLRDVPAVSNALEALLSPNLRGQGSFADLPSVRSLFEVRSRLSTVRANGDQMSQAAAGRAVRALDNEIARIADNELIQGDASAIRAWQEANRMRAEFGRRFEGGDLVDRITARDYRGGGMTNALAPEDVSNAIMGTGQGVAARPNMARDLSRIASMAPEAMDALRGEAGERLLRMRGDQVAPDLETLMRQSPEVARALITPQTRNLIDRARQQVDEAQGIRSAVNTGQRTLLDVPDVYRQAPQGANLRNATVSSLIDEIGRNPEKAIKGIGRNPNTAENLNYSLGMDADRYRESMRALNDRAKNARFIDPAAGSKTTTASMDAGGAVNMVSGLISGGKTAILGALAKLSAGIRLSPEERRRIVEIGLSEAEALRVAADPRVSQYLAVPASLAATEMVIQ